MTVITSAFTRLAQVRGQTLGMPAHPVVVIGHPLASKKRDDVSEMARGALPEIVQSLTSGPAA